MANNVLELCEKYTEHLNYDMDLAKKIEEFKLKWSYKDDDHMEFLASNLTGAHIIRFSAKDEEMLYADIFGIDHDDFEYELWRIPGINKNFKVSSNPTFILLMYLAHKFAKSKLPVKQIELVITNLYMIFGFKVLGSIYSNYFKYPVEKSIAKMVYEKQSDKYLLKQCKTWQGVLEYRAEDLLDSRNINYKRLRSFKTDDVVKLLNDLQGRLRDIIKNIYVVLMRVKDEGNIIEETNLVGIDVEGEEKIKDTDNKARTYIVYLKEIINSPTDFIQDDLIDLIMDKKLFPNIDKVSFRRVLTSIITEEALNMEKAKIDPIEFIITSALHYLSRKGIILDGSRSLYEAILALKAYWSSSSVSDPTLKKLKDHLFKAVSLFLNKKTPHIVVTYVLSTILYIFLRGYRLSKK